MNSDFEKKYKEMIIKKLDMLCSLNGRMILLTDAKNYYIDQLMIYCDERAKFVVKSFDYFARTSEVPQVDEILRKIKEIMKNEYQAKALCEKPQEDTILKSMESAVMAKMWLFYRKGMNTFLSSDGDFSEMSKVIGGPFGGLFPDNGLSIEQLIEKYPEDKINKWMEMQK